MNVSPEAAAAQFLSRLKSEENRPAFVTGSHAYGTPNKDSDVDLVVFMEESTMFALKDLLGIKRFDEKTGFPNPIYVGNLNIIAVNTHFEYDAWRNATDNLAKMRPVTRDFAINAIKKEKLRLNVEGDYPPSEKKDIL